MSAARRLMCGGCLILIGGCVGRKDTGDSADAGPQWLSLVSAEAWTEVTDPASDPFEDRPAEVECSPLGYGVESTYFEVETDDCAYGTFQQPALHSVSAGDEMELVFWHLDLWTNDKEAQGHLAVATAEAVLHESYLDIPSSSEVYAITFAAPAALVAGEPIFFHVHNHGYNSWSLGSIEALTVP